MVANDFNLHCDMDITCFHMVKCQVNVFVIFGLYHMLQSNDVFVAT